MNLQLSLMAPMVWLIILPLAWLMVDGFRPLPQERDNDLGSKLMVQVPLLLQFMAALVLPVIPLQERLMVDALMPVVLEQEFIMEYSEWNLLAVVVLQSTPQGT